MAETSKRTGARRQAAGKGAAGRPRAEPPPRPPTAAAPPLCSVAFCPICTMVTAMGEARPELVEHLLMAGREMLLAARAVIDARLESMDGETGRDKLERVTIE
ncbi:MAG TPA: hypothetical protein VF972_02145 [Actinomycetota bacterium]